MKQAVLVTLVTACGAIAATASNKVVQRMAVLASTLLALAAVLGFWD